MEQIQADALVGRERNMSRYAKTNKCRVTTKKPDVLQNEKFDALPTLEKQTLSNIHLSTEKRTKNSRHRKDMIQMFMNLPVCWTLQIQCGTKW